MGLKDLKERAVKRDLYAKATPHNWILLNEANKYTANAEVTNFNIYAGNRRRLRICENGNFRPHLCYFPIKCNFPIR